MTIIYRRLLLLWAMLAPVAAPVRAEAFDVLRDYSHTQWSSADGAPRGIVGLAQSADGWLWCATADNWYRFDGIRFERVAPRGDPAPQQSGVRLHDREGNIWIATGSGLHRYRRKRLLASGLPGPGANYSLVTDGAGKIWAADLTAGTLWRLSPDRAPVEDHAPAAIAAAGRHGGWQVARAPGQAGLTPPQARELGPITLVQPGAAPFISGAAGAGVVKNGTLARLRAADAEVLRDISGLVVTGDGDRWLNGAAGLARVRAADWQRSTDDPAQPLRYELFGAADGYPGRAVGAGRSPSLMSADGHTLWILASEGVVLLDTRTLPTARPAAVPVILGVSTDHAHYAADTALRLPPGTERFRIVYTAPLLRAPEAARFEIRLEGLDSAWQDAGNRRATSYTNIGPGRYTFHLRVFNEAGLEGAREAVLHLTVEPALVQTLWFRVLCALLLIVVAVVANRYRKQRQARHLIQRLDARAAERERHAMELNDTVIQSMHGVVMLAENAAEKMTGQSDAKDKLNRAIEYANSAIMDGLDRVHRLRGASDDELIDMFDTLVNAEAAGLAVLVRQTGVSREVHSVVRDELYAIGRQALRDALGQRGAGRIEVRLTYGAKTLVLEVRDDGAAAAAAMAAAAAGPCAGAGAGIGPSSLSGLCARAAQIGAKCHIDSRPGANLVRLSIAATLAYHVAHRP